MTLTYMLGSCILLLLSCSVVVHTTHGSFLDTNDTFVLSFGQYGLREQQYLNYESNLIALRDGGFMVAGNSGSTFNDGFGYSDILMTKFNSDGTAMWVVSHGTADNDVIRTLFETLEGDILVVVETGNYLVPMMIDQDDGTVVWSIAFSADVEDAAITQPEVGTFRILFTRSGYDPLIYDIDSGGVILQTTRLDMTTTGSKAAMKQYGSLTVVCANTQCLILDENMSVVVSKSFLSVGDLTGMAIASDGDLLLVTGGDVVSKISIIDFSVQWTKQYSSASFIYFQAIAEVDEGKGFFVGGGQTIMRIGSLGNVLWAMKSNFAYYEADLVRLANEGFVWFSYTYVYDDYRDYLLVKFQDSLVTRLPKCWNDLIITSANTTVSTSDLAITLQVPSNPLDQVTSSSSSYWFGMPSVELDIQPKMLCNNVPYLMSGSIDNQQYVEEGEMLNIDLSTLVFGDPDNDVLHYRMAFSNGDDLPSFMTFSGESPLTVSGIPIS